MTSYIDVISQIARFCDGNTLIALSRLGREYVSVLVEDTAPLLDIRITDHKPLKRRRYIRRSVLWRAAKDAQFPLSPDLSFLDDDIAYFTARARRLAIFSDGDIAQTMLEHNKALESVYEDIQHWNNSQDTLHLLVFEIKYRFLCFDYHSGLDQWQFATQRDIERALARLDLNIDNWFVIDLKQVNKHFSNHKSNTYDTFGYYPRSMKYYDYDIEILSDDGAPVHYYGDNLLTYGEDIRSKDDRNKQHRTLE